MSDTGPSGTDRYHHRVRSGDEPVHARSPLRLRLGLALTGLANGLAGVILFAVLGSQPLTWAFAGLCAIALINVVVVVHHIRQGAHYQPGPGIPPYRPLPPERDPRAPHRQPTAHTRQRRYLIMMGVCVTLLVLAWGWIRLYSIPAALAMSAAAAVIPPLAAILSNAGSPILHEDEHPDADERTYRAPGS